MLRGFSAIGLGGDMNAMEIPGSGWTVFSGILLVLCSLWILFQPLVFGTTAVVIWVGISLLFAGIAACSLDPAAAGAPLSRQPLIFPHAVKSVSPYKPLAARGFFVLRRRTGNSAVPKQRLPHKKKFHTARPLLRRGFPFPHTTAHHPPGGETDETGNGTSPENTKPNGGSEPPITPVRRARSPSRRVREIPAGRAHDSRPHFSMRTAA